jgi:hypothetical protein
MRKKFMVYVYVCMYVCVYVCISNNSKKTSSFAEGAYMRKKFMACMYVFKRFVEGAYDDEVYGMNATSHIHTYIHTYIHECDVKSRA